MSQKEMDKLYKETGIPQLEEVNIQTFNDVNQLETNKLQINSVNGEEPQMFQQYNNNEDKLSDDMMFDQYTNPSMLHSTKHI